MMEFTKNQEIAITHHQGPMMVLAGPGSGKTMVLTYRIKELITHYQVSPSNILVVTFTKAAAAQMKERFEKMMQGNNLSGAVTFGTFHSVFFKIIRFAYRYEAGQIIKEEQKKALLKEIVRGMSIDIDDETEFIQGLLSEISLVKGELLELEHYYSNTCPSEIFHKVYQAYEGYLRENHLIDFDDMQVICYQLFKERTDILSSWQNKYQYILVDEFQDICKIQYELVKLLAAPKNNLFIVGDDDQSIYRFRGARPEIMLGFEKDYPDTKRVLLDVNYRCDANIVAASLKVIGKNKNRFEKNIKPSRKATYKVETKRFPDATKENLQIVREILKLHEEGVAYEDVAVLFRTNRCAVGLVQKLMEYNLPFQAKDAMPNLYEHWISKNILTYIRVARGEHSRKNFLQIANRPNRYLKRESFSQSEINFADLYSCYVDKDWMIERLEKFEYDLMMIAKMSPYAAIEYIQKSIGYEDYLKEYAEFRRLKPKELIEVVDELKEGAKGFKSYEEWFTYIEEYAQELKRQSQKQRENAQGVILATMHSSKGLEFPYVYILDANEGTTPHEKANLEEDLEEERRLFYVAMTRAKDHLRVYCTKEKFSKSQKISRFIAEYLLEEKKSPLSSE